MAKLVLTDATTLQDIVGAINANNTAIEDAIEKTLSRDGTSPNAMEASLDMNSNRILNLPIPLNANEPARKQDLANVAGVILPNISSFMLTMLDDASASIALTTLGVSSFIKTLLDDVDAAAARTTLGVVGGALTGTTLTLTQGTITDPATLLSGTVTWNDVSDTFTGLKLVVTDTSSAPASLLLDLQVGANSKFSVRKDGLVTALGAIFTQGTIADPALMLSGTVTWSDAADTFTAWQLNVTDTNSNANSVFADFKVASNSVVALRKDGALVYPGTGDKTIIVQNGQTILRTGNSATTLVSDKALTAKQFIETDVDANWTGGSPHFRGSSSNAATTYFEMWGEAAHIVALRNSTSGQTLRIYNTESSSGANFERVALGWSGNLFSVVSEAGGTGTVRGISLTSLARGNVVTKTADFTLAAAENWVINNKAAATCTVTMPAASAWPGREVHFQNNQAQTLVSNASNIIPKGGGGAATAILPATATAWAILVSNGTNWVIMLSGT